MAYQEKVGTHNPGLILILLDQSQSMSELFPDGRRKADAAAHAVNRLIYEVQERCQAGERIKDRCAVGVIGYGRLVHPVANGTISELADRPRGTHTIVEERVNHEGMKVPIAMEMPYWVEPVAENGTPMTEALHVASELIRTQWLPKHPNSFPPVVINITDGAPNSMGSARAEALKLCSMGTTDGKVLLFNAHISNVPGNEILLPNNPAILPDDYARFLFDISTVIPDEMAGEARKAGFQPGLGSRGLVLNAGAETLVRLINFGSSVI